MNPLIQLKTTAPLLIALALFCFTLLPKARAVSPAPDGGYPGGNTAEGQAALLNLTTGGFNTAVGFSSLRSDTTNSFNTAIGAGTLLVNTAEQNTATGAGALLSNTFGSFNTANGAFTLFNNITGDDNTANGTLALFRNTTGVRNTANGSQSLTSNITGELNTATGAFALSANAIGSNNTANGGFALWNNTTGNGNTALGASALFNNRTGSNNVALGAAAGGGVSTANNVICIGIPGGNVSNSFYVANVFETSIDPDNLPVYIDFTGRLGTPSSSRRFKDAITPMDKASEAVLALQPVTFHYKSDKRDTRRFGLIAEEVAEVNPDLVVRNKDGEIYTVRYDAVNAMLLNEFLKEHHQVQDLKTIVAGQQKQIEALTAGLQKVSAQLGTSKPAPQVVSNP